MTQIFPLLLNFLLLRANLTVCSSGCDFTMISEAVKAVEEGGEVLVRGGDFREPLPLLIEKPLTLRGENYPTISGNGESDIIQIHSSNVRIEGLELRDSGTSYMHELAGIRVEDSERCEIINNHLLRNAYGVYLANSKYCTVKGNQIEGSYRSESESGNGIHSWSGEGHQLLDNKVSKHRDGIYLEFTNDSSINGNNVTDNVRYGLHFMTSHRNQYSKNRFAQNGAGVAVMYSRQIEMVSNTFANNRGTAAYGLLLKDISAGKILHNIFQDNTYGVYMEGTNRAQFVANRFLDNGFALRIFGDCDDNHFERNDFIGNTFDVTTNSSRNPNVFNENYWNHYEGYDLNHDGIGDVPYRPVSLSSVILEKLDASYVLIKSPLLLILDQVEQAFPMLIPESLKDEKPLMESVVMSAGEVVQ